MLTCAHTVFLTRDNIPQLKNIKTLSTQHSLILYKETQNQLQSHISVFPVADSQPLFGHKTILHEILET